MLGPMRGKTDEENDAALAERARNGDSEALGELVVRYAPQVSALVYQHVGDPEVTRDISQTTFLKACGRISGLHDVQRFRAWLFRIAINESVEHIRRERAQKRTALRIARVPIDDVAEPGERPIDRLIAAEERERVIGVLDRLPPRQRSVFVMRHFHGMSNQEIADILACSTSTVKANMSYALKWLREKLAGDVDHE